MLLRKIIRKSKGLLERLEEINSPYQKIVSFEPQKNSRGDVLFYGDIKPFLLKPDRSISNSHILLWQYLQEVRTFLDLGYSVDVVYCRNERFIPHKDYSFFVSVRRALERLAPLLNKDCVKIMRISTSHTLFLNAAEAKRLLSLQQRRGVTLQPQRCYVPVDLAIEYADYGIIVGNEFTLNTFKYANKPIYSVPNPTTVIYPEPEEKNFEACRKNFLWLGSRGFVHKGLDLALDAFTEMPDYHLTICGPVDKEEKFVKAFHKELYQTPNIHTVGWIDVGGSEFRQIINNCIGLIYPSSSEGQAGAVVTCLHAGLIPVISQESGVDVEDFGVILKNSSIEEIRDSVQKIASLPAQELKLMARKAWDYARANHTKEKFAKEYRQIIENLIAIHRKKKISSEQYCLPQIQVVTSIDDLATERMKI